MWYKSKLIIKLRNILKYKSVNLIILYCYIYFMLLSTIEIVIWITMGLIKIQGLVLRLIRMKCDLY